DRYQGTGILKAYFAIIFRNKCVDVFRRSTTKITAEDIRKISDVLGLDESTAAADAEMLRQEEETTQDAAQMVTKACLDKAKSVLTEKELCVLTQYRINELRAAEVARICGYRNARVVATVALNAQRKLHESIQQLCRDEPRCQLLCRKSNNQ
ncbi:MAG: hypothetical protein ABIQ93_04550, partial [Saprospiraceae bacterium]